MPGEKPCSCDVSKKWSGVEANISHLMAFEERLVENNGTIERIWTNIETKASKAFVATMIIVTITFVGTLFGLVYTSNQEILEKFSEVEKTMAVFTGGHKTIYHRSKAEPNP